MIAESQVVIEEENDSFLSFLLVKSRPTNSEENPRNNARLDSLVIVVSYISIFVVKKRRLGTAKGLNKRRQFLAFFLSERSRNGTMGGDAL